MSNLSENLKLDFSGSIALILKDGLHFRGKLSSVSFETKIADIDYENRSIHVVGNKSNGDIIPIYMFSGGVIGVRLGDPTFDDSGKFQGLRVYVTLRLEIDLEVIGDIGEVVGVESPYRKDLNIMNSMIYV